MRDLKGKVAVVTGAGSGIGRGLACLLAKEGCKLAISDIREESIQETKKMAEDLGAEVHAQVLDVSDREAFHAYADQIAEHYGKVNLVFNNAGVALGAPVHTMSYEDLEWLLGVNLWGMIHGTKAFLPHLLKTGDGHIVNVSSVFGIFAVPTQSAYNISKFGIRGFTEALRMELEIMDCGVSASSVHPGGIKTNIANYSKQAEDMDIFYRDPDQSKEEFQKIAGTTPDQAAAIIVNGVKKNKRRILIGKDAVVLDWIQRHFPCSYQKILIWGMKRQIKKEQSK